MFTRSLATSATFRRAVAAAALLATVGLAACNTVSGAGQDVTAVGHGVSNGANSVANHM